ncbi:MAG: transcription elongation factor GreAB [Denitromonas halophila]|uniref:Transcription elongation factor GreAB n=1 Tax=Denitromonas halophila TaxID=1629404 RepID=A0A558EU23_9RHOO|nr:GreA/GreB family elongation factor [Denitromonas halophila]TVO57116.1 transcription elongation factor GreAB [Denitromonas halophila]TVT76894.1 MAG: transcription elongation factor GreAB [Denitromonas halophila]
MRSDYIILGDADFVRLMALNPEPQLRAELEGAVVMPTRAVPRGVVMLNSRVRYIDDATGVSRDIEIVYPTDADAAAGKVSVLAPVGSALIGLSVGEQIDWTFPDGRRIRLRVEDVLTDA